MTDVFCKVSARVARVRWHIRALAEGEEAHFSPGKTRTLCGRLPVWDLLEVASAVAEAEVWRNTCTKCKRKFEGL